MSTPGQRDLISGAATSTFINSWEARPVAILCPRELGRCDDLHSCETEARLPKRGCEALRRGVADRLGQVAKIPVGAARDRHRPEVRSHSRSQADRTPEARQQVADPCIER